MTLAHRLGDALAALFYPQECARCRASVERLADGCACAACWSATRLFDGTETICGKCGALWPVDLPPEKRDLARCGRCRDEPFAVARAVGVYEGALRAAVLQLKRAPHLPTHLADGLAAAQRRPPLDNATRIVPVPLHKERRKERKFNQAEVIGQTLARAVGLPCDEWSLAREHYTPMHRAGMDAKDRRESVAEAFCVTRPRLIAGERVLLVDDVFTTGATASACAAVLLAAGAREVKVLTLARVAGRSVP